MRKTIYRVIIVISLAATLCLTGCSTDTVDTETKIEDQVVKTEAAQTEDEEDEAARIDREEKIAQAEAEAKNVKALSEMVINDGVGEIRIASTTRKSVAIPSYVIFPAQYEEDKSYPMVMMFAGFSADHDNGTRFDEIAEDFANENNMFVVMYDYPGYGASEEDNTQYTLTNMENDAKDVINYMKKNYSISKVGAFGYDVGGRVIMELVVDGKVDFEQVELIAPYCDTQDFIDTCFGQDNWDELKAKATAFDTVEYGEQEYSKEWFDDWEEYYGTLTDKFVEQFKNKPSMVVFSTDDEDITLYNMELLTKGLGSASVVVTSGGHSLGVEGYDTPSDVVRVVKNQSVAFMLRLYEGSNK